MAARVNSETFEREVLQATLPVLVEFYSEGCIPCKQLSPLLAEMEEEYEDRLKVLKVNVIYDLELAEEYLVVASPTILIFHHSEVVDRIRGFVKKDVLIEKIEKLL